MREAGKHKAIWGGIPSPDNYLQRKSWHQETILKAISVIHRSIDKSLSSGDGKRRNKRVYITTVLICI
jgi:hypothetical protein